MRFLNFSPEIYYRVKNIKRHAMRFDRGAEKSAKPHTLTEFKNYNRT